MFRLELGSDESDDLIVVVLRGELDLVDAAGLAGALGVVTEIEPRIIVDLSGLEFIDAAGVAALSRGRRAARAAGGELLLAAPQRPVQRVLTLIWETIGSEVYASVAEATARAKLTADGRADPASRPLR